MSPDLLNSFFAIPPCTWPADHGPTASILGKIASAAHFVTQNAPAFPCKMWNCDAAHFLSFGKQKDQRLRELLRRSGNYVRLHSRRHHAVRSHHYRIHPSESGDLSQLFQTRHGEDADYHPLKLVIPDSEQYSASFLSNTTTEPLAWLQNSI